MKTDQNILLCFGCQRRISEEELRSGRHDHVDVEESLDYDIAVNSGID